MPYEGEYASYGPLRRVRESEKVQQLLKRAKVWHSHMPASSAPVPVPAPEASFPLPSFALAIDGSINEVEVNTGYPGARVGYCTVASVLLDLMMIDRLDENRPVDPVRLRDTEESAATDAALPGSNVVTRRQTSAQASFREELYDHFASTLFDDDGYSLLDTYETLLKHKPQLHPQHCPYSESDGCTASLNVQPGVTQCPDCNNPIYSTDALRIHERFRPLGTNGEVFGLVMQVSERLLLLNFLQSFERRKLLKHVGKVAFFLDGPLAVFGPPAWLSAAISIELKRTNALVRAETGGDMIVVGIEKSGEFVDHFDEIDQLDSNGEHLFAQRELMLLTDTYIKNRIQQSSSNKRYGADTYFGRKFFYKAASDAMIVANIAFLNDEQDTLASAEFDLYPQIGTICALLDKLACSRYRNSLTPIVSAHAEAAIPLNLGKKVLQRLAQALMGEA